MTYEGLARKYRPGTFSEVVGQQHVVKTLSAAIERNKPASAYLFIGGRGLGKTSMARLLAKGLNCAKGPTSSPCGKCESCADVSAGRDIDVLEIDAASHTGVDNVRDVIIQSVSTAPVRGRVKIFIIDEVHMLSTAAFNALLKTLEEPPANVVFILATTDGHKVPDTIRSRCQRFDFKPIVPDELVERLLKIAKAEKIELSKEAARLLCDHAEGGMRDALSSLDLVASFADGGKITPEIVVSALGLVPEEAVAGLIAAIQARTPKPAFDLAQKLIADGIECGEIVRGLLMAYRRELHAAIGGKPGKLSRGRAIKGLDLVLEALDRFRNARYPNLELELLLARLASLQDEEIMLAEVYRRVVGDGGTVVATTAIVANAAPSSERSPEKSVASAAVPSPNEDALLALLKSRLSPVAAALFEGASIEKISESIFQITFANTFLRERFEKEKKNETQVVEILSAEVGRPIKIIVAGVSSATAGQKKEKEAVTKGAEIDPQIERIKRIFKTDVVEVLESKPKSSR